MSALLLLAVLAQAPAPVAAKPVPVRLSLVFGGDVIPHDPVKYVAKMHAKAGEAGSLNNEGWDHVFGPLAPVLSRHELAVVNLETPIVTVKKPEKGEMIFNAPPPMLAAMKKAGVDVATFANNHCLDQHREGITSTREHLAAAGLLAAGADVDEDSAWKPLVVERSGLRVGFLAITRWLNGFNNKKDPKLPHVPAVPYESEPIGGGRSIAQLLDVVKARAKEVDALFVTVHWGNEYKTSPAKEDRALAKQLLDAGAFAVIGHHPHVLQPVELVERSDGTKGLVAFSLGNLVSNQDFDDASGLKRDGLLLEVTIGRDQPASKAHLVSVGGVAIGTENRVARGKSRNVQPVLIDDELAAMEERLAWLAGRKDAPSRAEKKALAKRLALTNERRDRVMKTFAAGVLEAASASMGTP